MTSFQKPKAPDKANANNTLSKGYLPITPTPLAANVPINDTQAPDQQQAGTRPPYNPASNGYGMPIQQTRITQIPAVPGPAASTVLAPPRPEPGNTRPQQAPEIVNGHLILHRSEHFFLRTAYRPGQRLHPLRKPTGNTRMMPRVMPDQHKRVAEGETRLMPSVAPINPLKKERFPVPVWFEAIFVVIALVGSFIAHAINMFNFPRYELDEGTYMSSAWAILHGQIAPYAYGYGHPPLAWIQIAGWI